jgi:hypothetical protein
LFVSVSDQENAGLRTVSCGSAMAMMAEAGAKYTTNLLYEDARCTIVLTKTGSFNRIKTEPLPAKCP